MNSSKSALAATIVVFVLALAAAIFAIWYIGGEQSRTPADNELSAPADGPFRPTPEQENEMAEAAERLIQNNHEILRLFVTRGLPAKPEPYGNRPENDIYYVDSDEYASLEQIKELVFSTFPDAEAAKIMDGSAFGISFAVYHDKNGSLGIHMDFEPDKDFPVSWVNPSYQLEPISETECLFRLELSVDGQRATFTRNMYKRDGHWYLNSFILLD